VVRGVAPEEPAVQQPAPAPIPTPEQLGIAAPKIDQAKMESPKVDWVVTHQRMQELGAVSFALEHPSANDWHFVCWLPGDKGAGPEKFDGRADNEAEAVRLCLQRATTARSATR
jgi:hypothetical protein